MVDRVEGNGAVAIPAQSLLSAQLSKSYAKLIAEMRQNRFTDAQVQKAITSLETAVTKYSGLFALCVEKDMVRDWLIGLINDQLDKKTLNPDPSKDITSMIDAKGRGGLQSLLNYSLKSMNVYDIVFSSYSRHSVTDKAWKAWFGDKKLTIGQELGILEKEVYVWAKAVSMNPEREILDCFATHRIIVLDDGKMAESYRQAMYQRAKKSIDKACPDPGAQRSKLLKELDDYLSERGFKAQADYAGLINKFILNDNKDGVNEKSFDYLGQTDDPDAVSIGDLKEFCQSALMRHAEDKNPIGEKEFQKILALSGLATAHVMVRHLQMTGGKGDYVFRLAEKSPDAFCMTTDDFGFDSKWSGYPSIEPDGSQPVGGTPLNKYLKWELRQLRINNDGFNKKLAEYHARESKEEAKVAEEAAKTPVLTAAPVPK
jgi:hypothetical protein